MIKKTITLVETQSGHFYEIVDPEINESIFLPSSTTILSCFPNPGLDIWLQTSTPEEIKRAQEDGKMQGTKTHKCVELQIMGDHVFTTGITDAQIKKLDLVDRKLINYLKEPLTTREEEALIGFENFWEEYKPITVASELMVFSGKHGYAGTLDWVGYLWNEKKKTYEFWIVDWKISKTLDRSYDLQLASYWKAVEETYKKKFPKARLGILQLGKNKCKFSFKEVKDKKKAWDVFLTTKKIYDDLHPNSQPKIVSRREKFFVEQHKKKGKIVKL